MGVMLGEFRVGSDIAVALDLSRGDIGDVTGVTAMMAWAWRENGPLRGTPVEMTVEQREPDEDTSPLGGWTFSLSAEDTANMPEGIYAIDARLTISGGGTSITARTAYIQLTKGVFA